MNYNVKVIFFNERTPLPLCGISPEGEKNLLRLLIFSPLGECPKGEGA